MITGGFPCQDISQAGKQIGITGKRSGLYLTDMRGMDKVKIHDVVRSNTRSDVALNLERVDAAINFTPDLQWGKATNAL